MAPAALQSTRRENSEDEIVLSVLDAVERDPAVTQRSVAREVGIALGLANAYLRRCIQKGLIKVSEVPRRRYGYYLTPRGFAEKSRLTAQYLSHSLSFFRRARNQCAGLFAEAANKGQRRIVLIGEGDLAEIASLVAREHPVEILAVLAAHTDATALRAQAATIGGIDAVAITALDHPREVHSAALDVFGDGRVYAPALLRINRRPASAATSAESRT
jgi:predicted transcriptional regulator